MATWSQADSISYGRPEIEVGSKADGRTCRPLGASTTADHQSHISKYLLDVAPNAVVSVTYKSIMLCMIHVLQ